MNGERSWLGPALLAAVALLIGWRTIASTRFVLRNVKPTEISAEIKTYVAAQAKEESLLARVRASDALLARLGGGESALDPFHPRIIRVAPSPEAATTRTEPKPPAAEAPSVVLAAVDIARPEVVLKLGEQVSGLLTQGAVWNGWTVLAITPQGVEVEGFGRKIRLAIPNRES